MISNSFFKTDTSEDAGERGDQDAGDAPSEQGAANTAERDAAGRRYYRGVVVNVQNQQRALHCFS